MAVSSSCFLNGICGAAAPNNLKKAIEDPVLAPFVEVQIKGPEGAVIAQASNLADIYAIYGDQPITIGVGNQSFPAVVKSLQVGTMRGAGADIEILDQEAGDFRVVFERVTRLGSATDALCEIRWGWISTKCDGTTVPVGGEISDPQTSVQAGMVTPVLKFIITNVTLDYSAGTVKYTIHCSDTLQTFRDTKVEGVIPEDGSDLHFVDALRQVCNRSGVAVVLRDFTSATTPTPFRFRVADTGNMDPVKGMLRSGGWIGAGRSVLDCFHDWIRGHQADVGGSQGRGIKMYFDPAEVSESGPNGSVILMADTAPTCISGFDPTTFQVGTYVVNGGKCHPVISFKPQIGFTGTVAYTAGGTGGGSSSPGTTPNRGPSPCLNNPDAMPHLYRDVRSPLRVGHNVSMTISRDERFGRGVRAMRYAYNSMYMNNLAMLPWSAVSAELKVQGDPTFSSPQLFVGRFLRLIVINPFQIDEESPCIWSNAMQPCNEVLSNGAWVIDGVYHDIRNGSYTTTFKIRLATPGYDVADFANLGGGT